MQIAFFEYSMVGNASIAIRAMVLCLAAATMCCSGSSANLDTRTSPPPRLTLEQCQAIRMAEEFVRQNGYTDAPPRDKSKIRRELMEKNDPLDIVLALRRNELKPHAYGLFRRAAGAEDGWTVLFEYSDARARELRQQNTPIGARGVSVRSHGSRVDIWIEHLDLRLDAVSVQLGTPEQTAVACASGGGV